MRGWEEALSFVPDRLRAARQNTQLRHLGTARKPRVLSASGEADLRLRVEEADGDQALLLELAHMLTPPELRGLVRGLGQWSELRPSIEIMLRGRPKASMVPVVWSVWCFRQDVPEVSSAAAFLGERFGWEGVLDTALAAEAQGWVTHSRPGEAVVAWLDTQGLGFRDVPSLPGHPFPEDSPIARAIREALLMHGSAHQLLAEHPTDVVDWFEELAPEGSIVAGQHFLSTIQHERWPEVVLQLLRSKYGLPGSVKALSAFWKPLPEAVQLEFRRWFIKADLAAAIGHDSDRHRYWSRWADSMTEVQRGRAGKTHFALLYFPTFAVIEFFEIGNAAYFYSLAQLERLPLEGSRHPSSLKRLGRRNRLVHGKHWQFHATRMVQWWDRQG